MVVTGMPRERSRRRIGRVAAGVLTLLAAGVTLAAPPAMTPGTPTCLSPSTNTVVSLALKPETGWSSVRVYFRRAGVPDFYYLELRSDGRGSYWATLPRPDKETRAAEIQFAVRDVEGAETRSPLQTVNVSSSCAVTLSPDQERYARNLVVGETVMGQTGQLLNGWECTGVISRINVDGQLRPDATCRAAILAAVVPPAAYIVPAALAGGVIGGVIVHNREHEPASNPNPH